MLSVSNLYNFKRNIYGHASHLEQKVFELKTFVILFEFKIKHKITVVNSFYKKSEFNNL